MKIPTSKQIRDADAYTIKHTPIASIALMERAAIAVSDYIARRIDLKNKLKIFCGTGNNGGDGMAIARIMKERGYEVEVFVVRHSSTASEDFETNRKRLVNIPCTEIIEGSSFPAIESKDVIIDALFGSGLNRKAEGISAKLISHFNTHSGDIIAVDIPSGLFADKHTDGVAVKAKLTISFQFPKLAFFFSENHAYTGEWVVADIGLDQAFIENLKVNNYYTLADDMKVILKKRPKFSHKGNYGHAMIVAGSYGMMGAAILAARSAIRAGSGLVTAFIPRCGYEIFQSALPEAMVKCDREELFLSEIENADSFNAVGIGPGIGTRVQTGKALMEFLKQHKAPVIIDADAINIIALHADYLKYIPERSVLTPHPKEFERLAGKSSDEFERLELQKKISTENKLFIILKGAHTCITFPDGTVHFNSSGSTGLATAGSGDVLTGILTGLIARGYEIEDACRLGVYLHGLSGELASGTHGVESLLAGDIIEHLGKAFLKLY